MIDDRLWLTKTLLITDSNCQIGYVALVINLYVYSTQETDSRLNLILFPYFKT
jgi:hypothetical protein